MKKNIAIVTGGDSAEIVISLKSAQVVYNQLDREKFTPYIVEMRGNNWELVIEGKNFPINKNDFTIELDESTLKFDAVFIAMHGPPGEDGKLQGYFDMLGLPYTASDVMTSSLTFNKHLCNKLLKQYGINSAKSILIKRNQVINLEEISKQISFPCFVKPNKSGSSFGVSKVMKIDELQTAINGAFEHDTEVLIDEFIEGVEVGCGAYGEKGEIKILALTEIVSKKDFFDFEAKYEGMAEEITPARLPENKIDECHALTKRIAEILNCKGIIRVDYILKGDTFYLIEVNTIPGLSEESIVPKQAAYKEIPLQDLFEICIEEALD